MSIVAIETALEQRLLTMPGRPPVAWEDVTYKPTTGTAYLAVHSLRNTPIDHAITLDSREDRGVLQITVWHPAGQGKVAATQKAEAVAAHFAAGLTLTAGAKRVLVYRSPAIASCMPDDAGWLSVPVSISWSAT